MKEVCKNKIDIHAHSIITDCPDRTFVGFHSPEELMAKYDKYGIEKGFLLPLTSPEHRNFMMTTEMERDIAEKYPERFYFGIGLDPKMIKNNLESDFTYLIEFYKSKGAKVVGEVTTNINFDDPMYLNILSQCEKCDIPVIIHISPAVGYTYGVVDEVGLPRVEKILQTFPKLKLFGHSQAFWAHMGTNVDAEIMKGYPEGKVEKGRLWELFSKYENLYGDLSAGSGFNALARDEENGLLFLETFKDRLCFACDFCDSRDWGKLSEWIDRKYLNGELSEEAYFKICRENAVRIFKL